MRVTLVSETRVGNVHKGIKVKRPKIQPNHPRIIERKTAIDSSLEYVNIIFIAIENQG